MKKQVQSKVKQEISYAALPLTAAFSLSDLASYPYNYLMVLIPVLILEGILIGFYLHKIDLKNRPAQTAQPTEAQRIPDQKPLLQAKPKPKLKPIRIEKAEVVGDNVEFSVRKGLFRKRWFPIKRIPVYEIQAMELAESQISISWQEFADSFAYKKKNESFVKLRDQIISLLEERKKALEREQKALLRKNDLTGAINASINVVDLSFDILMALQVKRINWNRIESYANGLGKGLNFAGPTIVPFNLDFSQVHAAIKEQEPKETTKETLSVLNSIYGYFNGLSPEDDIAETHPNFKDTKAVISAYYMLNDLLLGRVVGERDSKNESAALETTLMGLASETKFKMNVDELKGYFDNVLAGSDFEGVVEEVREVFRGQLKQL
ncbi:MAG: hypothetical protein NWE98_01685 [Candidatus Bathyarchaeota archaeon]|nr:hypothetical protein [Candidatus Bathyarchaeota archaeon]